MIRISTWKATEWYFPMSVAAWTYSTGHICHLMCVASTLPTAPGNPILRYTFITIDNSSPSFGSFITLLNSAIGKFLKKTTRLFSQARPTLPRSDRSNRQVQELIGRKATWLRWGFLPEPYSWYQRCFDRGIYQPEFRRAGMKREISSWIAFRIGCQETSPKDCVSFYPKPFSWSQYLQILYVLFVSHAFVSED